MKKSWRLGIIFVMFFVSLSFSSAASCDLDVSLINQDPYPAIPGDYVKLVFQINGVDNPECGHVSFELLEQYPLSFDPDDKRVYEVDAGLYNKNFKSYLLAPYKVRVDEEALDGLTPLEVSYKYGGNLLFFEENFTLEIEDSRADFEVYVKDYDPLTGILTFEILNVAKSDIEALTLEIPKQENLVVKGSKTNIVGDLDSNEYTTADFEAIPSEGEITIKISYSDATNVRRNLEKVVFFDPEYFEDRVNGKQKKGVGIYIFWIVLIAIVVYIFYRRNKKKKALRNKLKRK